MKQINRKEITFHLSELTEKYINPKNDPRIYYAKEVTFDYASDHAARVDYVQFKPLNNSVSGIEKGDFFCFEIKSSEEDFHSKHGHNFIGDFNYYVMPSELYEKIHKEIPWDIGVFTPDPDGTYLINQKKAHRRNRDYSVSEMLLMMFRSANRENIKLNKQKRKDN